jgi:hypothetical protein
VSRLPKLVISSSVDIAHEWAIGAPTPEVWRERKGKVSATGYSVNGRHCIQVPRVATFHFSRGSHEVQAVGLPGVSQERIEDAYRRIGLPLTLQALGTEVLHASAVLTSRGVIAFCAVSGVGKSTMAFALSQRGYQHWADDSVAIEPTPEMVRAISIPFKVRLKNEAAEFFRIELDSHLQRDIKSDATEVRSESLLALMLMQRAEPGVRRAVEILQLTPSIAFPAVLEHAHCFSLDDPDRKRKMMSTYLEITNRVPVFAMTFQPGFEKTPLILDEVEKVISELS